MSNKYIECETAKEQIRAHIIIGEPKTNIGLNLAVEAIGEVPAADVVEVVRCRVCEFTYEWHGRLYCKRLRDRWNHVNDRLVDDTDFCTWGKHKDGGQYE